MTGRGRTKVRKRPAFSRRPGPYRAWHRPGGGSRPAPAGHLPGARLGAGLRRARDQGRHILIVQHGGAGHSFCLPARRKPCRLATMPRSGRSSPGWSARPSDGGLRPVPTRDLARSARLMATIDGSQRPLRPGHGAAVRLRRRGAMDGEGGPSVATLYDPA